MEGIASRRIDPAPRPWTVAESGRIIVTFATPTGEACDGQ